MRCEMHKDRNAVSFCVECGRGVCEECLVKLNGKNYCKECKEKIQSNSANSSQKDRYIVCESCGGYYKLQQGESLEDFSSCECGGKMKNAGIIGETKGTSNLHEIAEQIDAETVSQYSNNFKKLLINFYKTINWLAVFVGIFIAFATSILYEFITSGGTQGYLQELYDPTLYYPTIYFVSNYWVIILLALISGFFAGYTSGKIPIKGKNLKIGAVTGLISSVIGTTIGIITIFYMISNDPTPMLNLTTSIDAFSYYIWSLNYVITTMFIGALGGFIGTFARIKMSNKQYSNPNDEKK